MNLSRMGSHVCSRSLESLNPLNGSNVSWILQKKNQQEMRLVSIPLTGRMFYEFALNPAYQEFWWYLICLNPLSGSYVSWIRMLCRSVRGNKFSVSIPLTGRMFHEFPPNSATLFKIFLVSIPLTGRMFHEFKQIKRLSKLSRKSQSP